MEMYLKQVLKRKKTKKKKLIFFGILKANEEKRRIWTTYTPSIQVSRIRIRNLVVLIHGSESLPKRHGSGTLPERGVCEQIQNKSYRYKRWS
jgi:hypothetical protein